MWLLERYHIDVNTLLNSVTETILEMCEKYAVLVTNVKSKNPNPDWRYSGITFSEKPSYFTYFPDITHDGSRPYPNPIRNPKSPT